MSHPLSSTELEVALSGLPGWEASEGSIEKTYKFKNFREAVSFLVRLSFEAEEMNHHPEIMNLYNRVKLTLSTHDAGDEITERDIKLAEKSETLASQFS